jgi:hypothetical protein
MSAGDYWLALHINANMLVYWADTTTGDNVVASSFDTGLTWLSNYGGSFDPRAFSINGIDAARVPEPASALICLAGVAGLIGSRRTRRN